MSINRLEAREQHRLSTTPTYTAWENIVQRCTNPACPAYKRYGARGITLHESLRTFSGFLAEVGQRPSPAHSIDRINNAEGYCPGNLRWATRSEQQLNKRQANPYPGTRPHHNGGNWWWRYKRGGVWHWGGCAPTQRAAFEERLATMRARGVALSAADLAAEAALL